MPREIKGSDWWRRARRASGAEPPPTVTERLTWYGRRVRSGRRATYAIDGAVIVVSASIPAVAAAGGSAGLAGVLGARRPSAGPSSGRPPTGPSAPADLLRWAA
jgi:hypothetical protein